MPLNSGAKDTSYATWALTGQHADWALTRSWRLPGSGSSPVIAGDDDSSPPQMHLRVHWKEDSTYDSYEVAPPLLGHGASSVTATRGGELRPKYHCELLMTHKYRGSQQSSREVLPKFIDSTQGEPKNICKP
jgi:hypothetical protein